MPISYRAVMFITSKYVSETWVISTPYQYGQTLWAAAHQLSCHKWDHNVVICEPLVHLKFIHVWISTNNDNKGNGAKWASHVCNRLKENQMVKPLPSTIMRRTTANIYVQHKWTDGYTFPNKDSGKTHNRQTMCVGQTPKPNSSASTCVEYRWPSVVPSLQIQGKPPKQVIERKILW